MDSVARFRQLFDYDRWANQAGLASLSSVSPPPENALRVFAHIIGGNQVWRARFDDPQPPGVQPWPLLPPGEFRRAIDEVYETWIALLGQFTDEKLDQNLIYRTTQGVRFETPIRDVLTHLLMHSTYHRGQVAAMIREAGAKPAPTDYVQYLRQKKA